LEVYAFANGQRKKNKEKEKTGRKSKETRK
jgi:hypothetical protein